jgi:hypothetical protein
VSECEYPDLAASTAYKKGCRCDRCCAANSERGRSYRAIHGDKMREQERHRREQNPEPFRKKQRRSYEKNFKQIRKRRRRNYYKLRGNQGFFLYGLLDSGPEIRYVGQTTTSLQERLKIHLTDLQRKFDSRSALLRQVLADGDRPRIQLLAELGNQVDLDLGEKRLIVGLGKSGCALTNFSWDWAAPPLDLEAVLAARPAHKHVVTQDSFWLYGLFNPNGELRYIGKTAGTPLNRLHKHLTTARRGASWPCAVWIRELLARNLKPTMIPFEEFAFPHEMATAEGQFIVGLGKAGHDLLNEGLDWLAPAIDPDDLLAGKLSVEEVLGRPATA